jgi:alternate signal-mediated exported protein
LSIAAETPRSRSKLTKALVATGVGIALLAGGGGTFAAWSSKADLESASIKSGSLELAASPTGGSWRSESTGPISDIGNYHIVPGESLVFTQNVDLVARGAALKYTIGTNLDTRTVTGDGALATALKPTIKVNDVAMTEPADIPVGTRKLNVEVTIAFPFESGNGTQNQVVNLENFQVTATQTVPTAASGA